MAQIAERDRVVELRGLTNTPAFEVGGKFGNVVVSSKVNKVHKGWRVVAVDGRDMRPSEVGPALRAARARSRYTVSFRLGDAAEDTTYSSEDSLKLERARLEAEEAARAAADRRAAEEAERVAAEQEARRAAAEREEQERRAAEEERRRRAALEELRAAEDAERVRRQAVAREAELRAEEEAERQRQAAEDAERRKREAERKAAEDAEQRRLAAKRAAREVEAEQARAEAEIKAQRDAVERHLEQAVGLPPREQLADPQHALLKALTPAKDVSVTEKKGGPCDKCDGPHHEDDCPHFKKKREKHKDAWSKYGSKKGGDEDQGGQVILPSARIIPQPGDGSCLFHSLAYGLKSTTASALRAEISDYIAAHPHVEIAGNPIKDWVLWDAGTDVKSYAKAMRTGSRWGGAVEIAVCAEIKGVAVHIYEKGRGGFARISAFGDDAVGHTVSVHYGGRVHYDALQV